MHLYEPNLSFFHLYPLLLKLPLLQHPSGGSTSRPGCKTKYTEWWPEVAPMIVSENQKQVNLAHGNCGCNAF